MYVEAVDEFDPPRDFRRINDDARSRDWNALMMTLQERAPEASPDEWWADMEQVFDLDWPQHRPNAAGRGGAP